MEQSSAISERIRSISSRIDEAAKRAGRDPRRVTVVAVTKTVPAAAVAEARSAGIADFGENRVQEALPKIAALPAAECRWHFIGRIQRNKIQKIVERFDVIQSFDGRETLAEADARAARPIDAYLQVNVSREPQKGGLSYEAAAALLSDPPPLERLRLRGLMGIGPLTADGAEIRAVFREFRLFFDRARERGAPIETLSMGMSGDFEIAVEEGSTMVRIGTGIFGERETR